MSNGSRVALVTGGAGFIGSNLAARLLRRTDVSVRILDNLSRPGVRQNIEWLKSLARPRSLQIVQGDVRDAQKVAENASDASEIYHFAAQVAVTTSVGDPRTDFDINANGTLNVLEAARHSRKRPMVLFTSTNKVYGSLESVPVRAGATAYLPMDAGFTGVPESMPLDFHSPYGCSKGAADQYVRDYARIYDLPTIVFRMSCIAGPRQFGNEDQGWVAHFLYSILEGQPITIYGDGLQVRDILHVDDLLDAMEAVRAHLPDVRGEVFNLGGGMDRSISVIEMLDRIAQLTGTLCQVHRSPVRPGDQPLYIADTSKLSATTEWRPRRSIDDTLMDIHGFWIQNRAAIEKIASGSRPQLGEQLLQEGVA